MTPALRGELERLHNERPARAIMSEWIFGT